MSKQTFAWYRYIKHPDWAPLLLTQLAPDTITDLYRTSDLIELDVTEWSADEQAASRKRAVIAFLESERQKLEVLKESA